MSIDMTTGMTLPAATESKPRPLDLHALYRQQAAGQYTTDIHLSQPEVNAIVNRLNGIRAIASVFTAASDGETLVLGEWMHVGLLDAVRALTGDIFRDIDRAAERKKGSVA